MTSYVCQQCGESFVRDKYKYKQPPKFCSLVCSGKSRIQTITVVCQQCGEPFTRRTKNYHQPPRFCSRQCGTAHKRDADPDAVSRFVQGGKRHATKKKGTGKHGIHKYNKFGCRCDVCEAAATYYRTKTNDRLEALAPAATAPRWGYQWTGPELEIASRPDLSALQVAQMIGRTVHAVRTARQRMKADPRFITLAGVRRPTA